MLSLLTVALLHAAPVQVPTYHVGQARIQNEAHTLVEPAGNWKLATTRPETAIRELPPPAPPLAVARSVSPLPVAVTGSVPAKPLPAPVKPLKVSVYFPVASSRLTSLSAKPLLSLPASQAYVLSGHADPRGSVAYNLKLSQARDASTAKWMKGLGLNVTKETADGKANPVSQGDPKKFWMDRRVDITIGY